MSAYRIENWLAERIAAIVSVRLDEIEADMTFASLGLDSARLAELSGELGEWLDERVEPSTFFDYPTIGQIANHLGDGVARSSEQPSLRGGSSPVKRIAIVGISCRYPGADGPTELLELMDDGRNAIDEWPQDRWPQATSPGGAGVPTSGGFVRDVYDFDAGFFGIAPAEAVQMDPQQRWLLELAWEALEDAGQAPDRIAGRPVGVFVGISTSEYGQALLGSTDGGAPLAGTSSALSIAANRISYILDLRGPSLAVDTACSSSLVAVHQACRSLQAGDCELALVGGVSLIFSPVLFIGFGEAGMLAPDGRCKTFDIAADGYGRGEGCGVVVLKPLDEAERDGDRIYAVICGSAVNQDGRSNGLLAPNGLAQQAVIRDALADAGVSAREVTYVEAHGTGTSLGDAIEASALAEVYGRGREPGSPCRVGSLKTNIGHLEAAAGLAGLIKTALAVHHRRIPASLGFETPNPSIDFGANGLEVPVTNTPWPTEGTARAAVSAFGFGGTNAHAVLEEPARTADVECPERQSLILPLSAQDSSALRQLAQSYQSRLLDEEPAQILALCAAAAGQRSHLRRRLAVVGEDRGALVRELDARLQEGQPGSRLSRKPRVVFAFPVQAPRSNELVRWLLEHEPAFAFEMTRCEEEFEVQAGVSPLRALEGGDGMVAPEAAAACLFAQEAALAAMFRAWGVHPDAVAGEGIGEAVAAYVAGALSLPDAVHVTILLASGSESDLSRELETCKPNSTAIPFYSSFALQRVEAEELGAAYWLESLREPGKLSQVFQCLGYEGYDVFLELCEEPPGSLGTALQGLLENPAAQGLQALAALPHAENPRRGLDQVLAKLYESGLDLAWESIIPPGGHPSLPHYPWQHETYRAEVSEQSRSKIESSRLLLGEKTHLAHQPGGTLWQNELPGAHDYLLQHRVAGREILPAAAFVQMALEAAFESGQSLPCVVSELRIENPLPIDSENPRMVQTVLIPAADDALLLTVHARRVDADADATDGWERFASARIESSTHSVGSAEASDSLDAVRSRCSQTLDPEAVYRRFEAWGADYGPAFRGVRELWRGEGEALGWVSEIPQELESPLHGMHPAFLDACLHVLGGLPAAEDAGVSLWVPVGCRSITLHGLATGGAWSHVRIDAAGQEGASAEVRLFGLDGSLLAELSGVQLARMLPSAQPTRAQMLKTELDTWFYRPFWQPLARVASEEESERPAHRDWLILADRSGVGQQLAERFERAGQGCVVVYAEGEGDSTSLESRTAGVDATSLRSLVEELTGTLGSSWSGVVHLWSLDGSPAEGGLARAQELGCGSVLGLLQALEKTGPIQSPAVWVVTRGAQPVEDKMDESGLGQAPSWGLLKSVPFECPHLRCSSVDLDVAEHDQEMDLLVDELLQPVEDRLVAFRGGERFVSRLAPWSWEPTAAADAVVRADGTYVVTGGLGGLGLVVAQVLVDAGARSLLLLGRSAPSETARATIAGLEGVGACVRTEQVDVVDVDRLGEVLEDARRGLPPLRGVFHVAGVIDDGSLLDFDRARLLDVLGPKVAGAWNLHMLTCDDPLDLFVLFSSAVSVLGAPGQANYAAANAFLDALAHQRRGDGRPGLSVNWGPWAEVGMAANFEKGEIDKAHFVSMIRPDRGAQILGSLLSEDLAQAVVLPYDLSDLLQYYPATGDLSLFSLLLDADGQAVEVGTATSGRYKRPELDTEYVAPRTEIERVIAGSWQRGLDIDRVGVLDDFFELGGDSVIATQVISDMSQHFGLKVDAEEVYDAFSIEALASLVEERLLAKVDELDESEVERLLGRSDGS